MAEAGSDAAVTARATLTVSRNFDALARIRLACESIDLLREHRRADSDPRFAARVFVEVVIDDDLACRLDTHRVEPHLDARSIGFALPDHRHPQRAWW
jgi:hypothetical protein